jgi:hypothetical protein
MIIKFKLWILYVTFVRKFAWRKVILSKWEIAEISIYYIPECTRVSDAFQCRWTFWIQKYDQPSTASSIAVCLRHCVVFFRIHLLPPPLNHWSNIRIRLKNLLLPKFQMPCRIIFKVTDKHNHSLFKNFTSRWGEKMLLSRISEGTRVSVVSWGTVLYAARSRVPFPLRSLDFWIDLIIPAALWHLGRLSLYQNWVTGIFLGDKRRPARKADDFKAICEPIF